MLLNSAHGAVAAAAVDGKGMSPLHLLCQNYVALSHDSLRLLHDLVLLCPAMVHMQDKVGRLPCHYLAQMPNVSEQMLLLVCGGSSRPRCAPSRRRRKKRPNNPPPLELTPEGAVRDRHGATPLALLAANATVHDRLIRAVAGVGKFAALAGDGD